MTGISLITIGGELLRGRIVNTNTTAVGKLLRENGFTLDRNVSIPDYPSTIRDVVAEEMAKKRCCFDFWRPWTYPVMT